MFVCTKCSKSFDFGVELLEHFNSEHKASVKVNVAQPTNDADADERHACDACDATFEFEESLKIHLDQVHANPVKKHLQDPTVANHAANNLDIKNEVIDDDDDVMVGFDSPMLDNDLDDDSEVPQSKVPDVPIKSEAKLQLPKAKNRTLEHRKSRALASSTGKGPLKDRNECVICKANFIRSCHLDQHMKSEHPGIGVYECNKCGTQFEDWKDLLIHSQGVCRKHEPEDDNNFRCKDCFGSFYTEQAMKDHFAFFHRKQKLHLCPKCGAEFAFKLQLDKHECPMEGLNSNDESTDAVAEAVNADSLICSLCNKTFGVKHTLEDHVSYFHNKLKRHQCGTCGKEFGFRRGLDLHNLLSSCCNFQLEFVCKACDLTFTDAAEVLKHKRALHRENLAAPFECKHCPARHPNALKLKHHAFVHHGIEGMTFRCDRCPQTYKKYLSLTNHVNKTHDKPPRYKCDHCDQRFVLIADFKTHLSEAHDSSATDLFMCHQCPKTFIDRLSLNHHERTHLDQETTCDKCGKVFKNRECARRHNRKVHRKAPKPLKCQICSKAYSNPAALERHAVVHTHQGSPCEKCGKVFTNPRNLRSHVKRVHEATSFHCKLCDKVITHSMRKHMITHKKERPFKCDVCEKTFKFMPTLRRHVDMVHKKLQVVSCDMCGKGFPQKQNLDKHMENVHQKLKPYQCDICGNYFAQVSSLSLHKKNIHKAVTATPKVEIDADQDFDWQSVVTPVQQNAQFIQAPTYLFSSSVGSSPATQSSSGTPAPLNSAYAYYQII